MKVYLSSTYNDLHQHRAAVDLALRRMGHDVIGMEQYVAEGMTPVERCKADVRAADAYLVLVGWRYGHVPKDSNPKRWSITEIEFETAIQSPKKPVLAFLLDPQAPWPPSAMDARADTGGREIAEFRARLGSNYVAGVFTSPDNVASQAAAAVAALGANQHLAELILKHVEIGGDMAKFARGDPMHDSTFDAIRKMVSNAEAVRWIAIRMLQGEWWSTRLYLLAALIDMLTPIRQMVFCHADGSFAGMATPAAVRAGLGAALPQLAEIDEALLRGLQSRDVERETNRCLKLWSERMPPLEENNLKVSVRWQLVGEWLGERLVRRCIQLPPEDELTMFHLQQIIDSLLPDVPIERQQPQARPDQNEECDEPSQLQPDVLDEQPALPPIDQTGESDGPVKGRIMVVDRDAFALELAREWVRTGLPRASRATAFV